MTFTINERTITNRVVNCFIPYPDDEEGGGWNYKATTDGDVLYVDFLGNVRLKHLPTLVNLLETAIKEDINRAEEYGSITFDYTTYYGDEEGFEAAFQESKAPVVGMNPDDFWICNGYTVDHQQKSISTITLLRASSRYIALEFGNPMISFDFQELEGITALLKKFLP